MKFIKNVLKFIIFKCLSIIYIPVYLGILLYVYFGIKVNDMYLYKYVLEVTNDFFNPIALATKVGFIFAFIVVSIVFIAIYIGFPFLATYFLYLNRSIFVVPYKNSWCEICYTLEEVFHRPHKKRETGDEWKERIGDEFEKHYQQAKNYEKEQKKKNSYEGFFDDDSYSYNSYNNYQESNQSNQSNQSHQSNTESSYQNADIELEKAMGAFYFDDLNFTESELKSVRNRLIKTFHSDNGEQDSSYAQKINRYYNLLKQYARKN